MATKKSRTTSRRASLASDRRPLSPMPPREKKPAISVATWVTVILLALVIAGAYGLNTYKAKQAAEATPTSGSAFLFTPDEGTVQDIKIESSTGASVEVARDAKGVWVLKAPTEAAADQAQAEAAASQVPALRVIGDVTLDLNIVGLDKPAYTMTIAFSGGKTHKLLIGSVTPIQTGYYAQLDGGKTQIIDKAGMDALFSMLTNPPYAVTPTPFESATPTSTPTPELTGTPATAAPTAAITATP